MASVTVRRFPAIGLRLACILALLSGVTPAQDAAQYRTEAAPDCLREAVDAHVVEQISRYGPLSRNREYFGFVFVFHGQLGSAVTRGHRCWNEKECSIDTRLAAPLIPKGAKVLGEWHTHPRDSGAETLSPDDMQGAYDNRHIRCYAAYYSQPKGNIYAWDSQRAMVPEAMASLVFIGNYVLAARLAGRSGLGD